MLSQEGREEETISSTGAANIHVVDGSKEDKPYMDMTTVSKW
jgi:hypothetical protein